ncbi:hypothetical protein BCT69_18100 [Enterovibrio norvegicus]|nr:hypothetical protein BCT69_18100 [Enterovibrio norvegicus]
MLKSRGEEEQDLGRADLRFEREQKRERARAKARDNRLKEICSNLAFSQSRNLAFSQSRS